MKVELVCQKRFSAPFPNIRGVRFKLEESIQLSKSGFGFAHNVRFYITFVGRLRERCAKTDPPPLKWSDLRYVFDIKEDCNGK